jgi:hypothetical protein
MNEYLFNKRKDKIIQDLVDFGVTDEIIKYEYNRLGFVTCRCKECNHEYETSLQLLRNRTQSNSVCCTICNPPYSRISSAEDEIYNWISEFIDCERHDRKILNGLEVDIVIPSKNLAIEYNGIYWHSDLYKDKNYHLNKTLFLKQRDITLIHVWEDLWDNKKDIIKNRILYKIGKGMINIGARECSIHEISREEANIFFERNHLQGRTIPFKCVALKKDGEILSCIAIGKRSIGKRIDKKFEILRFCNKIGYNIMGGFSRLFNHVYKINPGSYISYADLSWGEGEVYRHAGFNLVRYSKPNYWYFIKGKRFHRYTYRKSELVKWGYDKNKTEFRIMNEDVKAIRIYDCGNAVWEFKEIDK